MITVTPEMLQNKKKGIIEYSKLLDEQIQYLPYINLVARLHAKSSLLIDYIMLLEQYIGEHEGTWMEYKKSDV